MREDEGAFFACRRGADAGVRDADEHFDEVGSEMEKNGTLVAHCAGEQSLPVPSRRGGRPWGMRHEALKLLRFAEELNDFF